ncbi:hypothetical protein LJB76_02945 [Clostridia bacterium OttesenSCG-928-O13]|nr:hypothetical protein [Clostridia bacterium OttesenSCG-928-O13]
MQRIMEPVFEIAYLIGIVILGIVILRGAKGRKQYVLFGAMAIVLGGGDAFHLVPRMWALIESGTTALPQYAAALGIGKLVTSITMTVFYVMLYHVWVLRYGAKLKTPATTAVYGFALARIVLCVLPQNQWTSMDAPLLWGILRNIPFVLMGAVIIVLYYRRARKTKDRHFRFMWLAIALSFALYIPVVLFADSIPMLGMLMIPKTIAYVWIVLMGFAASRDEKGDTISENA